jgi:putative two-component system response regulator
MTVIVTSGAEPRCVIADDEPRLRRVLARLLTAEGFRCEETGNGVEALEALRRAPAELLLTDMRMPQMDGLSLLAAARELDPVMAIVMVTAVAEVDTAVSALSKGASDYIVKPFNLDEIRARVRQAMEKRRLVLENLSYQEHLEERVQQQAGRIEELFRAGIQALANALEVKDRYTRGHSVRVSRYACLVAREMRMPDDFVEQVDLGGQVHDIGKIGVRESVLNKPSRLTPEEYRHIMTHPEVGHRLLAPLLAGAPVALNVVLSHHERMDGKGLPHGLAGDAIPREARIAAVADSFDAMTSLRPYRDAALTTVERALAELRRCSGTQFDPDVVDVFVKLVERGDVEVTGGKPLEDSARV